MKKVLKILLATMLVAITAVAFVGCDNGANAGGEKGLLIKKIDGVYTIYDYVEVEGETTLDIGKVLEAKGLKDVEYIIKEGAFEGNTSLTKITVSDKAIEIGSGAFKDMTALQILEVPFVGKTAVADAFYKQTPETVGKSVDRERTMAHFFGNTIYDDGSKVTINYGAGDAICFLPASFKQIVINASADYSIPMYAFNGASNLTNITINGAKAIGEGAFKGCVNVKEITIPASVTTIYKNAFDGCTKLENVYVSSNVTIMDGAFNGCLKVKYFGEKIDNPVNFTIDLANVLSAGKNAFNFGKETYQVINNNNSIDLEGAFGETKRA